MLLGPSTTVDGIPKALRLPRRETLDPGELFLGMTKTGNPRRPLILTNPEKHAVPTDPRLFVIEPSSNLELLDWFIRLEYAEGEREGEQEKEDRYSARYQDPWWKERVEPLTRADQRALLK